MSADLRAYVKQYAAIVPEGGADVHFFRVAALPGADASELRQAIEQATGDFISLNPLDGEEHSYIEIGAWAGDQGMALMLMGMGKELALWSLFTPRSVFGNFADDELLNKMAGCGMVTVKARTDRAALAA